MLQPMAWRPSLRTTMVRGWAMVVWLALAGASVGAKAADAVSLVALQRSVEPHAGIAIDYTLKVNLSRGVVEAMQRGIPVQFIAQATVVRPRWYWRDERIARATRVWRVAWQPLTSNWRVAQGAATQTFMTLEEAVASIASASNWLVADPQRVEPDERYLVQFSWQLDTTQLPPPLQIGIGSAASEWNLKLEAAFGVIP